MINDIFYNTALFIDKFLMPCERQLHTARFARLHEMTGLLTQDIDREGLLLGTGRFGRVLQVKSSPTHRELGNLFIVAFDVVDND